MKAHVQQDLPDSHLLRKTRFQVALVAFFIGLVMAIVDGVIGWRGEGLAGEWGGPGAPGMLLGIFIGLVFGLQVAALLFLALWAAGSAAKATVATLGIAAVVLVEDWMKSGWAGVLRTTLIV